MIALCSVVGCGGPVLARGWCRKHYLRVWKKGSIADPIWIRWPSGTKLTHEILLQVLSYDKATGIFRWLVSPSTKVKAGSVAGYGGNGEYWRVMIFRRLYLGHRLAWFYVTGKWPAREIDHRDTDRSNLRWDNLRDVTRLVNSQNVRRARSDSGSGVLGAMTNKKGFMARIKAGGKFHYLGTFSTPSLAHAAYVKAKRILHEGCTL